MASRREILAALGGMCAACIPGANAATRSGFQPDVKVNENDGKSLPPTASSQRQLITAPYLELADTSLDGATWFFANGVFQIKWTNPGGDWRDSNEREQGPAAYATVSITSITAPQNIVIDVTALTKRWLEIGNTGLHLRAISGPAINIASRKHATEPAPALKVVTSAGTFDCPCFASIWIDPSAGAPVQGGIAKVPTLMRFDLSKITGTLIGATLKVRILNIYSGPLPVVLEVNRLDMARIITDPARQLGGVTRGIAATVARDSGLASHADVLTYDDLVSESYINDHYLVVRPTSVGGLEFELDSTYGFTRALCYGNQTSQRAVAWHKWAQPLSAPPRKLNNARWRRPYKQGQSLGYDEIFFRFMFRIGADLRAAFNEDGMKLPGLAGTYDWSTSGAVTSPPPSSDGTFEARLWHSKASDVHQQLYRAATYWYGADHSMAQYRGIGSIRYFNRANFCFKAEQEYAVEQHVKLNTFTNGVLNHDGIYEVWIDGVLVHRQTDVYIRKYPEVQIQDLPFVNIYHGGMGMPKGRYHICLASMVTATKYIGPPTPIGRKPRAGQPPAQSNFALPTDSPRV
jgi:hypothetical protein